MTWNLRSKLEQIKSKLPTLHIRREAEQFIKQISTLLDANFNLYKSLLLIYQNRSKTYSENFKQIETRIIDDVHNGKSFYEALSRFPECFSMVTTTLVKIGEESGNLARVLDELTVYLNRKEKYQKKIRSVLSYPFVVLGISFFTVLFLMLFILPAFTDIFDDFEVKIPVFTRMLMTASKLIMNYWWILIIGLLIIIWGLKKILKANWIQQIVYRIIVKLPIAGNIIIKVISQFYANIIATLLENGIKMNLALELCRNVTRNLILKTRFGHAIARFSEGETLAKSLNQFHEFSEDAVQIIAMGEESGNLAQAFRRIDDILAKEIETTLDSLTSMLEPIIIVFMAIIVGSILVAMYLPIFEISTNLNF